MGSTKSSKYECVDCENYKRKICETEKTVSGRDVLIDMLQQEIKKVENLYKKSIDDYEKLRFIHCTTVQELSNLKEIHKKLKEDHAKITKERDSTKSQLYILETETEKQTNQYKVLENKFNLINTECCLQLSVEKAQNSSHKSILKEVMNIESIIQNQSETLKSLFCKLLDEVQNSKHNHCLIEIEEKIQTAISKNENQISESKSSNELMTIIEELNKQIEKLNDFVIKLKLENDTIKNQLSEKISNLSACLGILEKNHSNINNLSENIDSIISEKEYYLQEIKKLKEIVENDNMQLNKKEREIYELKCKLSDSQEAETEKLHEENVELRTQLNLCMQNIADLQKECLEKEDCTIDRSILDDDIKQMEENNRSLNEILIILTNENKSNLEKIAALNQGLKDANEEFEKRESKLKQQNLELEKEMEECKTELKYHQEQQCQSNCDIGKLEEDVNQLKSKIQSLETHVEELTLENTEYEEENQNYHQKIYGLISQIRILEEGKLKAEDRKLKAEEDSEECCKSIDNLIQEYEIFDNEKESEIKMLKEEINKLKKYQQDFSDYEQERKELQNKIVSIEEELNISVVLKTKIEEDNCELRDQINNLQTELIDIHQNTEKEILYLQEKIDALETQQSEKLEQLSDCCEQIENIKKIADEQKLGNESQIQNFDTQKVLLENENIQVNNEMQQKLEEIAFLKNNIDEYKQRIQECEEMVVQYESNLKDMMSTNDKLYDDIKEMNAENCHKQHIIIHLEQCVEKSNNILEECEKELKELHTENENFQKDADILKANLKKYVYENEVSKAEKNSLQEKLSQILKQNQQLNLEKAEMTKNLEKMKLDITNTSGNIDKFLEENKEKSEESEQSRKQFEILQKSSEEYKAEYDKIKKVYIEIKLALLEQIKKYNAETENLNKENTDIKLSCKSDLKSRLCSEKLIKEMELNILEKGMIIKSLEYKIEELSYEISQLRQYVHKLISDNKTLKDAIDNLLNTLVGKLKSLTFSGEDIAISSACLVMQEILSSLVDLEKQITHTSNSFPIEQCDCMSVITSQYQTDKNNSVSHSGSSLNSTCKKGIPVLKKHENINIGHSSEILNIGSDCCSQVKSVRNQATFSDRCGYNNRPMKHVQKHSHEDPKTENNEPLIIKEPDE